MKKKMVDGIKIALGAVIIAVITCLVWFGMFEMIFLDPFGVIPYLSKLFLIKYIVVVLAYCMICVIPVMLVIVHILVYSLCKRWKYLDTFQSKKMLVLSSVFYVIMRYWSLGIYCRKLDFGEGLGLTVESVFSLVVAAVWILILVAFLIGERKRSNNSSSKDRRL